jgi:hypothetical protein
MYLAERVYDNLALQVQGDGSGLSRRAIQAPKLMMYESREINLPLLDMWPGDAIDLFSADSLCNAEDKYACARWNSSKSSAFPESPITTYV